MRIGIDARCLEWCRGGVSRILLNLIKLWSEKFENVKFILYFTHTVPTDLEFRSNVCCSVINGPSFLKSRRIIVEQFLLPFSLFKDRPDVFFASWYTAPLILPNLSLVVGAWDISYTTHPDHYNIWNRFSLGFFSKIACKRADKIITCSNYDKYQIVNFYTIDQQKIHVLLLNADERFFSQIDCDVKRLVKCKYGLPDKYILSLGVIHNRRNVDKIIKAFYALNERYDDINLIIVGTDNTKPKPIIEDLISPLVIKGRAKYIQWIDDDDLPAIYSLATLYVCTSTVDGETILLKEAMAVGTPIMTSEILVETVGGFCLCISDPNSVESTYQALDIFLSGGNELDVMRSGALAFVKNIKWNDSALRCAEFIGIV